jgi:predicted DNA-binding transcriptional regulator AlpA
MTTQPLITDTAGVLAMTGMSRAWLYRTLRDDKTFPRFFKIGARKNSWLRADVEKWILARAGVAA